jgi:thiol-disulfide isomerase/thioredoxin
MCDAGHLRRVLVVVALILPIAACGSAAGGPVTSDDPVAGGDSVEGTSTSTTLPPTEELPDLGPAPQLVGLDGWLQTDISSLDDLKGKVVVVQFWTFGCYNCKNTLPNLEALYAEHTGAEFEIVGVHSPEFSYEEDPTAIAAAAEDLGVTWPIALDTQKKSFFSWQGSPAYWPRTYVLDRDGVIRFDHIGEGAYDELNQTVASLLG